MSINDTKKENINTLVIKKNGLEVEFDPTKIVSAVLKAIYTTSMKFLDDTLREKDNIAKVHTIADQVKDKVLHKAKVHVDELHDEVEVAIMDSGLHAVAKEYILYRAERKKMYEQVGDLLIKKIDIKMPDGSATPLKTIFFDMYYQNLLDITKDLPNVDVRKIVAKVCSDIYDGATIDSLNELIVMTIRNWVELDPEYDLAVTRFSNILFHKEAENTILTILTKNKIEITDNALQNYLSVGMTEDIIISSHKGQPLHKLFDLNVLNDVIDYSKDNNFDYLGLRTLYDRYFLHSNERRYETAQVMFMRVSMGLALNEDNPTQRAIEFYELLSSKDYMTSTPTLFNALLKRSQLSSCYLTTIPDDLHGIYGAIQDNAMLSKFAGGLGNDWTPVRSLGAYIKGTNGKSQGVVPFLKVANDTAVAVNQCFAPNTRVYTSEGTKDIKDIVKGKDLVLGISGRYREVIDHMVYTQPKKDGMVSVDIKHSLEPEVVTAGHPFYTIAGHPYGTALSRFDQSNIKFDWVEASDLTRDHMVGQVVPREILTASFNGQFLTEEDFYIYGLMLGDGHCTLDGYEFGLTEANADHVAIVKTKEYLVSKNIHYWETTTDSGYQLRWSSNKDKFPFSYYDLYTPNGDKRIAKEYSHLPHNQTLSLIAGLLHTDGNVSRGKEITFSSASRELAEGMRYQLLRLSIPSGGGSRFRTHSHSGIRENGSAYCFNSSGYEYTIRIPAVADIANLVGAEVLTKFNWITANGFVFSRVKSVTAVPSCEEVHDLLVDGDESYMLTSGLAHNGGKRKGAVCAYLEVWHADIEEFLELRKNTGDDRRRTHDMNTANWVPDLFMKRVFDEENWTLFSPHDVPDLHDLFGYEFEERYCFYEKQFRAGKITGKSIPAIQLWRKMLGMLFETGHPWITFKDACNMRSPQQHCGVVHSSNLCTEITLNTKSTEGDKEIAVCNLGSINLPKHINPDGSLDKVKLKKTITTAVRMLDNVIDINFYAVQAAEDSNMRHRPIGLGQMGFSDALYLKGISFASQEAVDFSYESQKYIAMYAIEASALLAKEKGVYSSYEGSLWSKGILPIDSAIQYRESRGGYQNMVIPDDPDAEEWRELRKLVLANGMRNSNIMAIAPTATIANICGVSQSIEPIYKNLYVKSNLSGEFTSINYNLVKELKKLNLWDAEMVEDLKSLEGELGLIDRIPQRVKDLFLTAFEVGSVWLIRCASYRQINIDQAQSLNLYIKNPNGKLLDSMYKKAWLEGCKTTYYLRALSATTTEKSTTNRTTANAVSSAPLAPAACYIDDPDCEACQ